MAVALGSKKSVMVLHKPLLAGIAIIETVDSRSNEMINSFFIVYELINFLQRYSFFDIQKRLAEK